MTSSGAEYRRLLEAAVQRAGCSTATAFSGRGIVIPGGGTKYFPCAWVTIRMLRALGTSLPIELWYLGTDELSPEMRALVEPYGVRCVDAQAVRKEHPVERLNGWELKPYAALHSSFAEVLLLDADNVPARDPSYLFESAEYRATGVALWPDRWRKAGDAHQHVHPEAWSVCGLSPLAGPECESGQLLLDKRSALAGLAIAMHLNEHSAYYYQFLYGDKDTYRIGLALSGRTFAMPSTPVKPTPGGEVFFQHDFSGRVVFQHRLAKWHFHGKNSEYSGFQHHAECVGFLQELRARWDGRIAKRPEMQGPARAAFDALCRLREFEYERVGHDTRLLELLSDGRIGRGAARLERTWSVVAAADGVPELNVHGAAGTICKLRAVTNDHWQGRWSSFERMPIALRARPSGARLTESQSALAARLVKTRFFEYHRVGHDYRTIELCSDGRIGCGRARLELNWSIDEAESATPILSLHGEEGVIARLQMEGETWRGAWTQFEKMPIVITPRPERKRLRASATSRSGGAP